MSIFHESHLDNILFRYLDDNLWNLSRCNKYYYVKIRSMLSERIYNDNNLDDIKYVISKHNLPSFCGSVDDYDDNVNLLYDSLLSSRIEFVKMCVGRIKRRLNFEFEFEYIVNMLLKEYIPYDIVNYHALEYIVDYLYRKCSESNYYLIKRFISIKYQDRYNLNLEGHAMSQTELFLALYVNNISFWLNSSAWYDVSDLTTILKNVYKNAVERGYNQICNMVHKYA